MFDLEESEFLTFWNVTCSIGIILVLTVILINTSRRKDVSENVPDNVVLLYQVGRGPCAPSSSPFPLKLETFLRMYKIPYVNDHSGQFSSKGKTPWIKYNGVAVADSEFCIEFLKRERNIDKEKISPFLKATGRALQKLTEENLYW